MHSVFDDAVSRSAYETTLLPAAVTLTGTMCRESLVKELGVTAPEITYHITTATNKREEIHGVQLDLHVGAIIGDKTMQFRDVW